MKYTFIYAEHEDYGTNGWRQEDQPDYDPLPGMAVAHDCLEHFKGGTGSPADELQALGASFVVRGEEYYCSKGRVITSPAINAAADMPEILRHIIHEGMSLPEPPNFKRRSDIYGTWVTDFLLESRKLAKSEMECEQEDEDMREQIENALSSVEGWLYRGITRALKRYRDRTYGETVDMFRAIEEHADKFLKHAEPGDRLIVHVVGRRTTVELKTPRYRDDY